MRRHRTTALALLFSVTSVLSILLLSPPPREQGPPHPFLQWEWEREQARERAEEPFWERLLDGARARGDFDKEEFGKEEGYAWDFFEWWYGTRAFPFELIPRSAYFQAWGYAASELAPSDKASTAAWSSIGPTNIGGRMLSLAVDPENPEVVWAGAASGGLWRSTTGGEGPAAWERIETGFPALSVSALAIDPADPQIMYLGTGEIGSYSNPLSGTPGARASYGIGVLKSVDRGATWNLTGLNWTMNQQRAVLALRVDPVVTSTVWAATSEGLYKSLDGGDTWSLSHDVLMAMDVVIDPQNHDKIFVSHGQLNSTPDPGIYRSTDGGAHWTKLSGNLPASDFGRTPLAIHHAAPTGWATLYAGVSNGATRQVLGLFKSTNDGDSWTKIATTNWAGSQAWYNNTIGLHPASPNTILCGGLDMFRSTGGGADLAQVTWWYHGYMGAIAPGGVEGPQDYVHADQHALAFDPLDPGTVYVATDGGIFKSMDGGATWSGKNGGLVTTQFYGGFAGGYAGSGLAVGGLQDNGTVKYTGDPAWEKIFGGDGGWCAVDPEDEETIYEEYVYLNMYKSWDGGQSWTEIHPQSSAEANFIAPFVICEADPQILYAGTKGVKKTTNGGVSWFYPDGNSNWNGTPMAVIGVSYTGPDTLLAGTGGASVSSVFQIRRSVNGGATWADVSAGLPNRYPTDIGFYRGDSRYVWLTFSGYGTGHVFFSSNGGLTWANRSGDLPDIPVQCVAVDPLAPDWVYVGTDLGVFVSVNGGGSWLSFSHGMPPAMILDLVIHPGERKMRAATFGNGVYEIELFESISGAEDDPRGVFPRDPRARLLTLEGCRPNPFAERTSIRFRLEAESPVRCGVYDVSGRRLRDLGEARYAAGPAELHWDGRDDLGSRVPAGSYFVRLTAGDETVTTKVAAAR